MEFSITLVLVIVTVLISIGGFNNQKTVDDLIFYPPAISKRRQFYRFITHGFIHADVIHLAFNMLALYSFGEGLEKVMSFNCLFGPMGRFFFLILYFTALIIASLPDYIKYKDSYHFRSLGASGAVSAIVFSMIIFFPQMKVSLFFLPGIPGYIFAILYLAISVYFDKRGRDNINHSAHFWGAAYGIVFTIVLCQLAASNFNVYGNFIEQIKSSADDLVLICE